MKNVNKQKLYNETQFDVIVMDPPWHLASAAPTRGVRQNKIKERTNRICSIEF
jgi:23S rRNA G2069 N7-methylase RlmK/C1962 C5-methylase RlmI